VENEQERMKYILIILFCIVIILPATAEGGLISRGSPEFSILVRTTYDNNILRYSARDRDRALNGTEFYQTPNKTLDDLRTDTRITATYRFKLLEEYSGRIQSSVNFATYLNSPLNNARWINFTYKQNIHKEWNVLYYYFYEPYYFIRDYLDVHTNNRHHADFALSKTALKVYYRPVRIIEFVGTGEIKKYAYNRYFTEYDGDRFGFKGDAIIRSHPWRVSISYGYGEFDNLGFMESTIQQSTGIITDDTETGDGNYQEDIYDIGIEFSYKVRKNRTRTKLQFSFTDRAYLTDRLPEFDPIHHARRDVTIKSTITTIMRITKQMDFKVGVSFINRDSEASDPIVKRVKSYQRTIGWIEVTYDL